MHASRFPNRTGTFSHFSQLRRIMESSFEILSIPGTIERGIRVLFKNSFLHAESIHADPGRTTSSIRCRSAPAVSNPHESEVSNDTTLMIRNVPSRFTQQTMLSHISERFSLDAIDFFYLPVDFRTGKSLGYCFVNFVSGSALEAFLEAFQGLKLSATSAKTLSIDRAKVQGLDRNCNLFKTSSVMVVAPLEFRPMIQCSECKRLVPLSSPMGSSVPPPSKIPNSLLSSRRELKLESALQCSCPQ